MHSDLPDFDCSYEKLLKEWCDSLIALQVRGHGAPHDGGFLCKACTMLHGRADNAVFPLMYIYAKTKEQQYYDAAMAAFRFQERLRQPDGSVINDGNMTWQGITVFSALNAWKTLHYFRDQLETQDLQELQDAFLRMSDWVYRTIDTRFSTNINYYAAAAECLSHAGEYRKTDAYHDRIRELFDYCMARFHEDGLFHGEYTPHDQKSRKGCYPVDLGYNLEESFLCLTETARALGDEMALGKLAGYAVRMLDFMLPDGGINNTFGCRNNKWTYYGSRTSDGCLRAMLLLSRFEPVLYEAACRNAALLRRCTANGELYGGLQYYKLKQPPCVHHMFCHAAGLADALLALPEVQAVRQPLPYETERQFVRYYPEIDTWQLGVGDFLATLTGYDFRGYTYTGGAAHASGGVLSMLYHKRMGPVMAGSVYSYGLTEMTNMQVPWQQERRHETLLLRWEYQKNGKTYTTCLDPHASICVKEEEGRITAEVESAFVDLEDWEREDPALTACFTYQFSPDSVTIHTRISTEKAGVRFILPIVEDTAKVSGTTPVNREKIFHLSGGLSADRLEFAETEILVTLTPSV